MLSKSKKNLLYKLFHYSENDQIVLMIFWISI